MRKFSFLSASLFAGLVTAFLLPVEHGAQASPVISFTSSSNEISNVTNLFGWQFVVNNTVTVDALGTYDNPAVDSANNQPFQSVSVGIYNASTQALLLSATVGSSDPYSNWFYWQSVAPYVLTAGTYDIVEYSAYPTDFRTWDPSGFAVNPSITYVTNAWENSVGSLVFPNSNDGNRNGYFGPNFDIAAATPLPATWTMMLIGLAGLGFVAYRQQKKSVAPYVT